MDTQAKFLKKVGKNLERLIFEKGYASIDEFSLKSGFHKSSIYRIVNGDRNPRFFTMVKIKEELGLKSMDEFLQ